MQYRDGVMETAVVTVSRLWHKPQIYTTITDAHIGLHISLQDFLLALKHELTTNDFDTAVTTVISGIKAESAKVL